VQTSKTTAKDSNGLAKAAKLKVGYPRFGIEEDWSCRVRCDTKTGVVTITKDGDDAKAGDGVLEGWSLEWKVAPPPGSSAGAGGKTFRIDLRVEVTFRNVVYDQAFALLPSVAARMLAKFEARMAEVDALERKERVAKLKAKAKAKAEAAKKESAKQSRPPAKAQPKKLEIRSGKQSATSDLRLGGTEKA